MPTDDTPGAREAGAVHFADRALETFMSDLLPIVRGGLEAMNGRVSETFDGVDAFADLSEAQQDQIITAVEQEDPNFFFFARVLVLSFFSADPRILSFLSRQRFVMRFVPGTHSTRMQLSVVWLTAGEPRQPGCGSNSPR